MSKFVWFSPEVLMKIRNFIPVLFFICGCNLFGIPPKNPEPSENPTDAGEDLRSPDLSIDKGVDNADLGMDVSVGDTGLDQSDSGEMDSGIVDMGGADTGVDMAMDADVFVDMGPPKFCQESLDLNPVVYWSFDNSPDGLNYPNLGNTSALDAGIEGPVVSAPGAFGDGVKFNGINTSMDAGHDVKFDTAQGTLALWFEKLGADCTDLTTGCGLFSKDAFGYGSGGHFTVAVSADNTILVRLQSIDATYTMESPPLIGGGFHHIAVSFGAAGMRLFVDGASSDTNAYTGGIGKGPDGLNNVESIGIGWSKWRVEPGTLEPKRAFFEGVIDEVLFFDRELTETDIQNLSNGCDKI